MSSRTLTSVHSMTVHFLFCESEGSRLLTWHYDPTHIHTPSCTFESQPNGNETWDSLTGLRGLKPLCICLIYPCRGSMPRVMWSLIPAHLIMVTSLQPTPEFEGQSKVMCMFVCIKEWVWISSFQDHVKTYIVTMSRMSLNLTNLLNRWPPSRLTTKPVKSYFTPKSK